MNVSFIPELGTRYIIAGGASNDLVEFGVAKGSRSCHVDLPRLVTRGRAGRQLRSGHARG